GIAYLGLRRDRHLRYIAQANSDRPFLHDDGIAELFGSERLAFGLQDHALVRIVDESGTAGSCGITRRRHHIVDTQPIGKQAIRDNLHLKLPDLTTEYMQ